jgi:hypothetical protein
MNGTSPFADRNRLSAHPRQMRRVVLESPFSGDIEANMKYARECLRDCLLRNESPVASHILFASTATLDDSDPVERAAGINAGHAWFHGAHAVVVYVDRGISKGMEAGIRVASFHDIPVEYRKIPGYVATPVANFTPEQIHEIVEVLEKSTGGPVILLDHPEAS